MPKNIKINLADCLGTSNKCGKVDEQRIWEFQRRLETLEAKPDNDNQLLSLTDNKLSITNGNEVTLPVYDDTKLAEKVENLENRPQGSNQTLSIEGNTLTISDGNSVELPTSTNKELEKVVENLKPLSNNISGKMTTYSGHSVYINKIGNFVHLTFDSYAVRNVWQLPEGFRPKFTQTAPLWHKDTGEYVGKVVLEPDGEFDETIVDKFKSIAYGQDNDPHDGTSIYENIHTLTMSYYVGG